MKLSYLSPLLQRTLITIAGPERRSFLQGLVSNDVELCARGEAVYAGFLTPQGKFLHDLFIFEKDDTLFIDCEADRNEDLLSRLNAYKLRSKVEFASQSTTLRILALNNRDLPSDIFAHFRDPRHPDLGERIIIDQTKLPPQLDAFDLYDTQRLHLGIADGSRDMQIEKSTLADGNFDLVNGISWTKGCYLGQELTARMHYRALIKKRLYPLAMRGVPGLPGTPVRSGLEEIGEMRSGNGTYGLAFLNNDKAKEILRTKELLSIGNAEATLIQPFWLEEEKEAVL